MAVLGAIPDGAPPGAGWKRSVVCGGVRHTRQRLVVQLLRRCSGLASRGGAVRGAGSPRPARTCRGRAGIFLIPRGRLQKHPAIHTRPGTALRVGTIRKDDVFLLRDVHRGLKAGGCRAKAKRALYGEWKGGGQANLLPGLGEEWWRRWQAVRTAKPPLLTVDEYRELGIDYLVVRAATRPPEVVFTNQEWAVIRLKPGQ